MTLKYKAKYKRIPPARPTYNSDVETVHKLIEDEFYRVESFKSNKDIINKTHAYLIYFNHFRKNRNRENQTPMDILRKEKKKNTCLKKLNFSPIIIDQYMKNITDIKKGGYFYCLPPTLLFTKNLTCKQEKYFYPKWYRIIANEASRFYLAVSINGILARLILILIRKKLINKSGWYIHSFFLC